MRPVIATALFAVGLGLGLVAIGPASLGVAQAADACGPGCHSAVNGGCVVDGWERGAVAWNECPAGAHPRPPCYSPHVWRRQMRSCVHVD